LLELWSLERYVCRETSVKITVLSCVKSQRSASQLTISWGMCSLYERCLRQPQLIYTMIRPKADHVKPTGWTKLPLVHDISCENKLYCCW
jgi:hypothetical protein